MVKTFLTLSSLLITAIMCLHLYEGELPGGAKFHMPFIDALERQAYDFRLNLSAREELDDRVIIIDIDERSLQVEGQWPWPRATFAKLLDQLFDTYGVDSVGFDVTFPEPEDSYTDTQIASLVSADQTADELLEELRASSGDVLLANALLGRNVVLGSVFEPAVEGAKDIPSAGVLSKPMFQNSEVDAELILQETFAPEMIRYTANIPILAENASATGFFSIAQQVWDKDGVIRRIELLNRYEDKLYGNLGLQLMQTYFMDEAHPVLAEESVQGYAGLEGLELLVGTIPLDAEATVYVPYAKSRTAYKYVPAHEVLAGTYPNELSGAIALVGTSAAGLVDLRNTPVSPYLPGVEVHANVVSAILDDNFRVKPHWITASDFITVIVGGLLLSFLLPRLSAFWGTMVYLSSVSILLGVNWYYWTREEDPLILSIAPMLFLITVLYFLDMVVGFFSESQARKETEKMFGLYIPPEVVGQISESDDIFSMKPEKREMSVLFSDIRDFTTISESMEPEELSEWLNNFLTPMTQIIHKHGGAIDKYMGDAIMAFWGAPLADANHARNAVSAAVEMMAYLETLNAQNKQKGWPEIRIGAGINTGDMSVGNMGSEFRMAYTVVGDAVNLGSRLEGLTKEYGVHIVVSEFTKAAAPNFDYSELDTVKVKGKNEAVTIYTCSKEQPESSDQTQHAAETAA